MTLRAVTTAQEEHSIHDVVENSVTKCDSFWKSKAEMKRDRAVKTGRWEWTKATETLSVSVTAFPLVEMAIKEFGSRSDSVTSTLDITVISGVGESAFVMTDKVESLTGVSFRKAGALVLVISDEQPVALRMARCIAESIPTGAAYSKLVPLPPAQE